VILLGGDPGIGKSTLLLQAMAAIGGTRKALYVTGEESVEQVAAPGRPAGTAQCARRDARGGTARGDRRDHHRRSAGSGRHRFDPDGVHRVAYVRAGSVAQVRECAAQLTRLAKERHIVVMFVGHVTKEGAIAGPRVLEHIVDTVLYFEGDTHSSFRLVRAIKNRFGAANELGSSR
jgi:DNA repair protein RadA/Sms